MRGDTAIPYRIAPIMLALLGGLLAAGCGHKNAPVRPPVGPPPKAQPPAPKPASVPAVKPTVSLPPSTTSNLRGPSIRIRLTAPSEELRIAATGEFILVEKTPEAARVTLNGQAQIRLERPAAESGVVFRVQVATFANAASAEKLGQELSAQYSQPFVVHKNASTGLNQLRLGRFTVRDEAQAFASGPIAGLGYRDAFVVSETGESVRGEPTLALRGPENFLRLSRTGYLFLPSSELDFLRLNGKPYRGLLDVSLGKDGRVLVVNQLAVEDYLFGVVPAELSPTIYPVTAALEAQAIAARTYALKNMGKFRAEGFDLTDDINAQVYGGVSLEKELSSDAVRRTLGIAIYYQGNLIDAMYMSTCGGRTEDFSEVFDSRPVPYLKSVFCTVENSAASMPQATLAGSHDLSRVIFADDGTPANRELELAHALGLIDLGRILPEAVTAAAAADEIKGWVEKSRALAGKTGAPDAVRDNDVNQRGGFLRYAAGRFFGVREIERSVSESDTTYYLGNLSDGSVVPDYARLTIAYLIHRKLWQPYPDNSIRAAQPILRSDALALLVRWILSARPEILKTAVTADPGAETIPGNGGGAIAVKRGSRTELLRLGQDVRLFKTTSGRSTPVGSLSIIGGEKLAYHQRSDGTIDYLEVELSSSGASSDRLSPMAAWQATMPRVSVAEKLRSLAGNVGEIQDLRPARLGASGRVVQLEVIGSRGSVVVNGYKARGALGLKDTLYTLSRTRSDDGSIGSFTFDGRGWGHGVGLCQTGAVGMARAGQSAEDILRTYYQGVELRKAY